MCLFQKRPLTTDDLFYDLFIITANGSVTALFESVCNKGVACVQVNGLWQATFELDLQSYHTEHSRSRKQCSAVPG